MRKNQNAITFYCKGGKVLTIEGDYRSGPVPTTQLHIAPNKVICDHVEVCESITCGHRAPHEFHAEICEIDHDGEPIACKHLDDGTIVKCVELPSSVNQRLEIAVRAVDILRGLERRTVCPECFHLRKAGHSYKCEIMRLLDDYEALG